MCGRQHKYFCKLDYLSFLVRVSFCTDNFVFFSVFGINFQNKYPQKVNNLMIPKNLFVKSNTQKLFQNLFLTKVNPRKTCQSAPKIYSNKLYNKCQNIFRRILFSKWYKYRKAIAK